MSTYDKVKPLYNEIKEYRRYLHQHPETAFEEFGTSDFIAKKLEEFGLEIHRGLGKTGVVATLKVGTSDKKIALRADMDALDMQEYGDLEYKSKYDGKMHGCGHDGHMAMLLGAAKHLTQTKNFDGTVYFIFQPAEEIKGGAKKMIDDGLFEKFPAQSVWGMHNFHGFDIGEFAIKTGAMMASFDTFEIEIIGVGCHAGMPHLGKDPIVGSAQVINALQTIASRNTDPLDAVVVSVTQIQGGSTWNVIPKSVTLRGTFRCLKKQTQKQTKEIIEKIVTATTQALGLEVNIAFNPQNLPYPVTINSDKETKIAQEVAIALAGEKNVNTNFPPSMGAEDFSIMLEQKPGCYIWIGNGAIKNNCVLHNTQYDFNDEALVWGISYWVDLTQKLLKV